MNAAVETGTTVVLTFEEWMIRDLTALVKAAYDESPVMRSFDFSEKRVHEMIALGVFAPDRVFGVAYVDMSEKEILGMLTATISGVSYSEEVSASDVFSYIKPAHREDGVARMQLIESYMRWAARAGIKKVFFFNGPLVGGGNVEGWQVMGQRVMRVLK